MLDYNDFARVAKNAWRSSGLAGDDFNHKPIPERLMYDFASGVQFMYEEDIRALRKQVRKELIAEAKAIARLEP